MTGTRLFTRLWGSTELARSQKAIGLGGSSNGCGCISDVVRGVVGGGTGQGKRMGDKVA